MSKYATSFTAGHIDQATKRVAVSVAAFAGSDLNGDAPAYLFNRSSDEMGLEPWSLIDGIDPDKSMSNFDIWLANGKCRRVGPTMTVFVSPKHAALIAA